MSITEGTEYTAIFHGGPFDGTTDTRTATSDTVDDEVTVYADVEGLQTAFTYRATGSRHVVDQVSVDYTWEPSESDPVDDLQDRGDRSGEFDRE
ncbi:oligoribonuclease [Curtobacterium sp. 9128]|uniref:oligoribonuclease n=1 Tax=Curtobacterium sp. 9128 TaxID=1793722 RepID=UPI00119DC139|nr:oligoribonuclease [Curtobacterium sp. 9128]